MVKNEKLLKFYFGMLKILVSPQLILLYCIFLPLVFKIPLIFFYYFLFYGDCSISKLFLYIK